MEGSEMIMRRLSICAAFCCLTTMSYFTSMLLSAPKAKGGGFEPGALGMKVPVLTSRAELDEHVGRLVAVRGIVSNSKIRRIAGVRVSADDRLAGREAYAVGILAKWVITEEDLEATERLAGGPIPSDAPGTKYVLYFDLAGKPAEARVIPDSDDSAAGK